MVKSGWRWSIIIFLGVDIEVGREYFYGIIELN